jgi:hypothetical protein
VKVTKAFVDGIEGKNFDVCSVSLSKVPKEYTHSRCVLFCFVLFVAFLRVCFSQHANLQISEKDLEFIPK